MRSATPGSAVPELRNVLEGRPETMSLIPDMDLDSRPWWEGLRQHRLLLQRCAGCQRTRAPFIPVCPSCGGCDANTVFASGHGTVYSRVVVHVPLSPGYEGPVPYTVATVELDEGPRLLGHVEGDGRVRIGQRVEACFADHERWTELRFRPC